MMYPYDPLDPLGSMNYIDPLPENPTQEDLDDRLRLSLKMVGGYILALFLGLAICALLSGCTTTKYVQVPVSHTDTVRMVTLLRDSIYRHDSIIVNQYTKGDTVYQNVDRWHTRYQDRTLHDTAYISRRDTISLAYPVEKQVAKPLTHWQNFQMWMGRIAMIALAVLLLAWIIRKRTWWIGIIERLKK